MADNHPHRAFAEKVDTSRSTAGISVLKLAELTDIPKSTLQRKLKGVDEFTAGQLARIASALGVSAAEWFTEAAA
jgi:transcriptional regulator with XRE-family HTH domain